jgi:hypothetical protein
MDMEIKDMASELEDDAMEAMGMEEPMSDDELQGVIGGEIDDAVDFIDNIISPIRAEATEYYRGDPFGDEEDGRSQVVSMDVRDTVQAILPSLMRIFTGSEQAVEYIPQGPEDVEAAEQATDYANFIMYRDNDGFLTLHSAFKDALIRKAGIVKVYWDEKTSVENYEMSGLDDAALAAIASDPKAMIEIQVSRPSGDPMVDPMTGMMIEAPLIHDVSVKYETKDGRVQIEALPPEEFLIDRRAKSMEEADFIAHRRTVTISELVAMGYDEDEVEDLATGVDELDINVERYTRNPALTTMTNNRTDEAMRKVMYYECYTKVDFDGDGIAELRKVCMAGSSKKILMNEPCAVVPFAVFCPDPEPHDFFGMSVADVTMDVQRIKSVIMRNTLDSLALSIHPRMTVVEGQVNIEDVMNTEVGAIIRQTTAGAVQPLAVPFLGQAAFPMLDYMDQVKESRTGISRASSGLDANALQNQTATAVNATVQGAQQRIEMIARVFAEIGMKQLFKLILHYVTTHQDQARMIRLRNEFVQVDPRAWNNAMDVSINVALGRGTDSERMAMLMQIGTMQKEAMQTMGNENPLTDMTKLSNTLKAMTELSGFKDSSQFWSDPADFKPAPQEQKPDVNEMFIQVQIQQIQADIQKKSAELELERQKMQLEDDFKRDKLEADILIAAEEMKAKYGAMMNVEKLKSDMASQRDVFKAQADVIKEGVRG